MKQTRTIHIARQKYIFKQNILLESKGTFRSNKKVIKIMNLYAPNNTEKCILQKLIEMKRKNTLIQQLIV
jgi:hypothetical protein